MNAKPRHLFFKAPFFKATVVLSTLTIGGLALTPAANAQTRPPRTAKPAVQAALTASQARALSKNVTDKVIVVFKDQFTSTPDTKAFGSRRSASISESQQPVITELKETHATNLKRYQLINAVAATVSAGEAQRLAANPLVASVVKDEPIPVTSSLPSISQTLKKEAGDGELPGTCPAPGKVQLDPQAIEDIHAAEPGTGTPSAQSLGYTGAGVKVAFIADGLDIDNPDFIRSDGQHVFVDYQDFSGTGTDAPTDGGEAFLDSSSIAAQGREVYNIASYGAGLPKPCDIRILGVAPGASLVGLNVFGSSNFAFDSVFLEAINYAVNTDHVNVLNESFGDNPFPDSGSLDLTRMANDSAVAAGVTVTVSSGDAGVTNTIGSPATDPEVISAGASTTYRSYAQTGIGGITYPTVKSWLDNNISGLSSSGFSQIGSTVDVVAPGDLNWALCTPKPKLYAACTNFSGQPASVELSGGTSEAAPLTAGTAALVIQSYEEAHGGTAPSPAVVKQIIVSTAQDISAPGDQQGAGLLDAYAAVQAAASYPGGSSKPTGYALLKSATQLNVVAPASTPESLSEKVTNTSGSAQTVALSSRTLGTYHHVAKTTVQIQDATGDQAVVHFTVPSGQARLNSSISYVGAGPSTDFSADMNLALISPTGQFAEYNLPQGTGNYGNAEVARPEPGTWTAWIFGSPSVDGGTVGPVEFAATTAEWTTFGKLSATTLHLEAGASAKFTLSVTTPAQPGDEAGSIVFTSDAPQPSFAATTTVPVTLRSLVPTPDPTTTFTGKLTGGNGRDFNTGQTAYYEVAIPSGLSELNASVSTPNPANTFYAELIDPVTGEAASAAASGIPGTSASGSTIVPEVGAQLHVLDPDPGIWTLAIDFYNQVTGTAITQPFTVFLNSTLVPVSSSLPDSSSANLSQGQSTTLGVTVTNNGNSPEAYFVDARLDQTEQLTLAPLTTSQVTVPITSTNLPMYLVPTHTTSITASASSTAPIFFDYWWAYGDPDLISSSAPDSDQASGTFNSNPVVAGEWGITPFQVGPDGAHGVTRVTATTAFTATTAAFDTTVTSPTGDFWAESLNPSATFDPYVVEPGQTITIPVTITPLDGIGTTVTGTLFVDDITSVNGAATWNELTPNVNQASDLAAIPYEYTIGR
jgi:Peptidase inhibitor I9